MRVSQALARTSGARPTPVPLEMPLQSEPGRYGHDGSARLINCYAEEVGKTGKSAVAIYASDGLKSFATLTDGAQCRGLHDLETEGIAISAQQLYSVDPSGTATVKGGIPGSGFLTFATNRATIKETAIVGPDGLPFVYTAGVLSPITDTDLKPANSCAFLDGYTLYFTNTGRVYFSGIDNATSIGANDFFTAEGSPDALVRGFVHMRTVFCFGKVSTELFGDSGDSTTPFQRFPGGFLEFGCSAPGSVSTLGQKVVLVDESGAVITATTAGVTQRISTHAVERDIANTADKTTIEGFTDEHRGHEFYVVQAANFSWLYDLTTGQWHERISYQKTRWRASRYMEFAGKRIVGDFESGLLYELDKDTYDEAGEHHIITMRFPVTAWPYPVNLKHLRVDTIPGQGLISGALHDTDPQLTLKLSTNGGQSFGNTMSRSIGKTGQYAARTEFDKLGVSDEDGFAIEASISADIVKGFTGLAGEASAVRR